MSDEESTLDSDIFGLLSLLVQTLPGKKIRILAKRALLVKQMNVIFLPTNSFCDLIVFKKLKCIEDF